MANTDKRVPFFARYLEGQEFPRVKTDLKAGRTLKFPSDGDEDVTLKYPSDDDEGGVDK
ncbi:MAG TPA: microviridin/marinostatin family tricyclic proteinase inhibitor [Blastocatellia bacterium]|nr:microviridin/marinostatin family tricyclic proteinase inhibitor [Blastocatellia bacterium]